jgi:hypothetical protein
MFSVSAFDKAGKPTGGSSSVPISIKRLRGASSCAAPVVVDAALVDPVLVALMT